MKTKYFLIAFLAIIVFGGLTWHNNLKAMAQRDGQKIYLWANDLSRNPGDPPYRSLYYRARKKYFSMEPVSPHSVIFLGDSITDEGEWSELFPDISVINRGIGGDTTLGVINRLDQIVAARPSTIFLMIGTNDLCFNRPIPEIIANYRTILTRFQTDLPDTKVYVQSVLPFNDTLFPSHGLRTNSNIKELDGKIKNLAQEYHDDYINLVPAFMDSTGRLTAQYTSDGLHLNDIGYFVWKGQIQKRVLFSANRPVTN